MSACGWVYSIEIMEENRPQNVDFCYNGASIA